LAQVAMLAVAMPFVALAKNPAAQTASAQTPAAETTAAQTAGAQTAAAQTSTTRPPAAAQAHVALTFDDLPDHGPLPPGLSRVDIAKSILDTLRSRHAPPVYGFINAKALVARPEDGQVLSLWRGAGFPLGNHAFSHMDLHANPVEPFEQDVLANEATLKSYMGDQDWHWFRFPYLREGDTIEKHRAILAFLKARGYRVAEVTLSFDDYAYNDPYARCLAKNDRQGLDWLAQSYLDRASTSLSRGQEASRLVFGRDIKHVMLLHIGGFETVMLPRLLDLLQQRGFALTTLEDAESDPAYAIEPELHTSWDGTRLDQFLTARHAPRPPHDDTLEKLGALCR
jgi:peptidoglycan/xylan/chitin deacetylase (PgdA/CDA1 family)